MTLTSTLFNSISSRRRRHRATRRFRIESLEKRCLLDASGELLSLYEPQQDAALAEPVPIETLMLWHNPARPNDVNFDRAISALDALVVINFLNDHGTNPVGDTPRIADFFMDTNDDGNVSPADVLGVVNELNQGEATVPDNSDLELGIIEPILNSNPFREVGKIVVGGQTLCTGTLITTQHVLTAAHCFDSASERSDGLVDLPIETYSFTFQASSAQSVTTGARRIHIHPDYEFQTVVNSNGSTYVEVQGDVALMFLDRPVTELSLPWPSHFDGSNLHSGDLSVGQVAAIVGYGGNGTGKTGWAEIDAVLADEIHWYNDRPRESTIEPGDSGGPMLRQFGDRWKLIGVHSAFNQRLGFAKDMRVKAFAPWIHTVIGNEAGVSGPTARLLGKTNAERPDYVELQVEYHDPDGIDMTSVEPQDLRVVSQDGQETPSLLLLAREPSGNGRVTAKYAFHPSGHHATYRVHLNDQSVRDSHGSPVRGADLGTITLANRYNIVQNLDLVGGRDYQIWAQDTELDTDDWTRVDVGYEFQYSQDDRGVTAVRLKLWMEAWELEKNQQYKGKTRIRTERVIPLFELTNLDDPRRIANVELQPREFSGSFSNLYYGEQHGTIRIGSVGALSDVEVRIDGRGRNDHLLQRLSTILYYNVVLSS